MMKPAAFWAKVRRGAPAECWPWTGYTKGGRGWVGFHGRKTQAYRVAILLSGVDPSGACVLHSCDNPLCCNPGHLRLGTRADNVRDRGLRGRTKGMGASMAKVLRELHRGGVGLSAAARTCGISVGAAAGVIRRRNFRYVD